MCETSRELMRLTPPVVRVLSIDPGANLGVSIAELDIKNNLMLVLESFTVRMSDIIRCVDVNKQLTHTNQEIIEHELVRLLHSLLDRYEVEHVIYESAYNSLSIIAYNSLVFYANTICKACRSYNFDIGYESVTPSQVKKLIGVKGNSGDKNAVRLAVTNQEDIIFADDVNLDELTEHAVDSIAIAYYAYANYRDYFYRGIR